jgi:MYXO-CTERM domain-containing protein
VDVGFADEAAPVELVFGAAEDLDGDALTYEVTVYGDAGLSQEVWKDAEVSGEGQEVSTSWPEPVAGGYFWVVRAVDSTGLAGEPSETGSFTVVTAVNEAPSAPVAVSPVEGAGVRLEDLTLLVDNAVDPEGDALTYSFTVYLDEALTQSAWSVEGVAEGEDGQTSVVVPEITGATGVLYWTARAHDGRQEGPSSQVARFTVLVDIVGSAQGSDCGCATPAAPARAPLWPLGLLPVVGVLLWRRRR